MVRPSPRTFFDDGANIIPKIHGYDGFMFARVCLSFVNRFADVHLIF